ncbi:ADP-heptose synthase [sediment metagenome]|uniref:ADP-heptose synthase n=1 Tax=sediment metagenome TaxID=749907 RepID=D9PME4_9ZZZZ
MISKKIFGRNALKPIIDKLKKQGKRIVFTNGCFDLLHPGHLKSFADAKRHGDILVVAINSDRSVKKIKGPTRPVIDEKGRAAMVAALEIVDYVTIFSEETPYELIKLLRPNILAKGGDWKADQIIGREFVNKVVRIKLKPGVSTTDIIKKISC